MRKRLITARAADIQTQRICNHTITPNRFPNTTWAYDNILTWTYVIVFKNKPIEIFFDNLKLKFWSQISHTSGSGLNAVLCGSAELTEHLTPITPSSLARPSP